MTKLQINPGIKFGMLSVVEEVAPRVSGPDTKVKSIVRRFLCRCDCGGEKICRMDILRRGDCISCGCIKRIKKYDPQKSVFEIPEYFVWHGMKRRCSKPNTKTYKFYGAKGVKLCSRWDSFINFYEDMGPRPDSGWVIDRIDPYGDYEPENCRWQKREESSHNKRTTVLSPEKAGIGKAHYLAGASMKNLSKVMGCSEPLAYRLAASRIWKSVAPNYDLLMELISTGQATERGDLCRR